jgi:hypothetical protein
MVLMSMITTMRKQVWIVLGILMLASTSVYAQRDLKEMDADKQAEKDRYKDENKEDWREKVSFGGALTGGFSTIGSFFLIQPQVFYRLLPRTTVGAGLTYIYWSQKYTMYGTNQTVTFTDNAFGFNLLARQTLFGPVFAHVEYMPMNFTAYNMLGQEKRIWGNSLYLGGGFSQGGKGGGAYVLVLYDVLWRERDLSDPYSFGKSYYTSPWNFRVGFMF